jgi:predicted Zn-dependent protease
MKAQNIALDVKDKNNLLTINEALNIAKQGRYSVAESILKPLVYRDSAIVEAVDLLAKIYAQQGQIKKAQELWFKMLKDDPSNLRAIASLKKCALSIRPGLRSFALEYIWLIVSISLWFLIAMLIIA